MLWEDHCIKEKEMECLQWVLTWRVRPSGHLAHGSNVSKALVSSTLSDGILEVLEALTSCNDHLTGFIPTAVSPRGLAAVA